VPLSVQFRAHAARHVQLRSALEALRARLDAAGVSELFLLEEVLPELVGEPCRFESLALGR
jgi:hypothetical protein